MKSENKNYKPPYISVAKMNELFTLLATRSFTEFSAADLISRGFSKSDAFQSIQGLKFLNLVHEDGKINENIRALSLKGNLRQEKLQQIVKDAYKKLFARVTDPTSLSKDQLYNEFVAEYNLSPRLANTAVPVFLWLCKEAGMKITEDIAVKKVNKTNKKVIKKTPIQEKPTNEDLGETVEKDYFTVRILGTRISVNLPKNEEVEDAVAAGEFTKIREEIKNFAKKLRLTKGEEMLASNEEQK